MFGEGPVRSTTNAAARLCSASSATDPRQCGGVAPRRARSWALRADGAAPPGPARGLPLGLCREPGTLRFDRLLLAGVVAVATSSLSGCGGCSVVQVTLEPQESLEGHRAVPVSLYFVPSDDSESWNGVTAEEWFTKKKDEVAGKLREKKRESMLVDATARPGVKSESLRPLGPFPASFQQIYVWAALPKRDLADLKPQQIDRAKLEKTSLLFFKSGTCGFTLRVGAESIEVADSSKTTGAAKP